MNIKTLAEILAESDIDSASHSHAKPKKPAKPAYPSFQDKTKQPEKPYHRTDHHNQSNKRGLSDNSSIDIEASASYSPIQYDLPQTKKQKKRKKRFHPAATFNPEPSSVPTYQPPAAQSVKEMLAEVKRDAHDVTSNSDDQQKEFAESSQTDLDNLPSALKAYLRTPEQKQAEIDAIKAESRLRWLAFYYLSRREYGKAELKQKLIDKEQDPEKVDALLDEFEKKGYQSDYRTTLMLIRENIRKGRGRGRIKQEFYRKKVEMPDNIDELIDMANTESEEFSEFVDDSEDSLVEGVDWLKLAVTARIKKYGNDIPTEQKDKARQLRFLQYRGFQSDICFAALNYTLETLDERF
ncbi:regulatory protein RecX [Psychrobacter sp. F1192]|uniref:Regulatory protein RecX n=1 Tax=Psychrobacter coccoides TaxID=2818440 RepID=A0ABS3NN70_9GAMM|nr:regulatory protein RecX [Psychrobacter coccoides]MBO1530867.1 regulatory protein RecX [Psychrobacter coccoides]